VYVRAVAHVGAPAAIQIHSALRSRLRAAAGQMLAKIVSLVVLAAGAQAYTPSCASRRNLLGWAPAAAAAAGLAAGAPERSLAATDATTRTGAEAQPPLAPPNFGKAPDGESPFVTLPTGTQVKRFKEGAGEEARVGSKVAVQVQGRLVNLNGVNFYNTKDNNPDGFGAVPLSFTVGKGEALPGLEQGVVGMKKGEIRRIIVPPEQGYLRNPGLEPVPMNAINQNALDSVVKNPRRDSTVMFDVKLERLK